MDLRKGLPYDPFDIFRESKTPPGLYARKRWLKESSKTWETDFRETVGFLKHGQGRNGSWKNSPLETIKRLFGLHLTVRDSDEDIDRALDWLAGRLRAAQTKKRVVPSEPLGRGNLRGLPFTRGHGLFFLAGATLFLSSIFGRGEDPFILSVYDWLDSLGTERDGRWCGRSSTNNVMRAFVVHPVYAQKRSLALAVRDLAGHQEQSGRWPRPVPFYQTVNALAHLQARPVDTQLKKSFKWLAKTQMKNGSWGRTDPEWKSFLVIHAMKNKNVL
jgi:hypothetical protein